MLMRKADEGKMENVKTETKSRSPLRILTPKKRAARDGLSGSPFKLKRLQEEEEASPGLEVIEVIEPLEGLGDEIENEPSPSASVRRTPPRMNLRSRVNQSFASPELLLRRKHKTDILRHTKSMTLGRLGRQKKENPSAIFR